MRKPLFASAAAIALLACGAPALAASGTPSANANDQPAGATADARDQGAAADAHDQVYKAAATLRAMTQQDPALRSQLRGARAVFILPRYGRGALVVGGSGGPGVAMVRRADGWTGPALYNVGGVSIGAQAGGEGGSIVMIVKSERALRKLEQANSFSLDANAGLSIVSWSRQAEAQAGSPDVVMWTDLKGLYAGAAVGVSDAKFDARETSTLYGKTVNARDILEGKVHTALADDLVNALPA